MNEIDELWRKIDEDPSQITPPELDKVILHYRKLAANHAMGIKPEKSSEKKIDINSLMKLSETKSKPDRRD